MTDLRCVERAQAGDRKAFGDIVDTYSDRIYGYLYHMLGDREDAECLSQETFVRAWQSIGRFRGGAAFSSWLYRIATNLAIDALRRRSRRGTMLSLDESLDLGDGEVDRQVPDHAPQPDEVLARDELQEAVWDSIGELSAKLKPVLVMYDFEQFSYEEIANTLSVPLGTVKSRLFHARQQLKREIAQRLPVQEYVGSYKPEPDSVASASGKVGGEGGHGVVRGGATGRQRIGAARGTGARRGAVRHAPGYARSV